MTNLKIKSPEIQIKTSDSTISGSPFSGDINTFSTQLTSILSEERQTELQEKSEKMKDLLKQLKEAVKARSDEIGYDYDNYDTFGGNYTYRLCQDNDILEKTLTKKVLTGDIKDIYYKIISLFGNDEKTKIILKSILYRDFLESLVYESIDDKVIEKNDFKKEENTQIISLGNKHMDINIEPTSNIKGVKSHVYEGTLDKQYTKNNIFKYIKDIKYFHFSEVTFSENTVDEINFFFKHFINSKAGMISNGNLGNLDNEILYTIFKHFINFKIIGLYGNNLGILNNTSLEKIFSFAKNAKHINLKCNNFSEEQESYIKSLLPNTKITF